MKIKISLATVLFAICSMSAFFMMHGCSKSNTSPSSQSQGQVLFWVSSLSNTHTSASGTYQNPVITVEGNNAGTITQWYSTAPTCTATGCVIFKGTPGAYNWRNTYTQWSGSTTNMWTQGQQATGVVTITSNGCTTTKVSGN